MQQSLATEDKRFIKALTHRGKLINEALARNPGWPKANIFLRLLASHPIFYDPASGRTTARKPSKKASGSRSSK